MSNVEQFYALDLDGLLLDTRAYTSALETHIKTQASHQNYREFCADRETTEARGESFDPYLWFVTHLGQAAWNAIIAMHVETVQAHANEYFLPGAKDFLATLKHNNIAHGILTYGSPGNQRPKLRALGLGILPHLITQEQGKGTLITSWQTNTTPPSYAIPDQLSGKHGLTTTHITLIDDRPRSFTGLPPASEHAHGILVHPERTPDTPTIKQCNTLSNIVTL